jgi:LmbE family N-acetylglucosaminyl deacetylase
MTKLTLMTVFAHPDDEAFGSGGTLTRYAAEGVDVHLVTATRGEAGESRIPEANRANMPFVRERELRCACETFGINPPHFMDYLDGQLPIVHQGQAVAKLTRIIREIKPQVILTFGPDGGYGHYDHIVVHRWATIAVGLAADPAWFADQLDDTHPLHQVNKLYFRATPEEQLASRSRDGRPAVVMMDGVPFPFVAQRNDEITTSIDVSAYLETKMRGIQCHRTQVGDNSPFVRSMMQTPVPTWVSHETFILARSTMDRPTGIETDLFVGLR